MAPTIKVQQLILPNVVDDVNFIKRARRWIAARRVTWRSIGPGYEKYPQPFTTHPNLGVYLGSDSPHPIDQVGCTVCHEGMGQSVSFRDASHTPSTTESRRTSGKRSTTGKSRTCGTTRCCRSA